MTGFCTRREDIRRKFWGIHAKLVGVRTALVEKIREASVDIRTRLQVVRTELAERSLYGEGVAGNPYNEGGFGDASMVKTSWGDPSRMKNSDRYNNSQGQEKDKGKTQNPKHTIMTATREPSSSSAKKAKVRPIIQRDQQEKVTVETLAFESVTGSECRSWWDETPPDHALKNSVTKAEVDHAI